MWTRNTYMIIYTENDNDLLPGYKLLKGELDRF